MKTYKGKTWAQLGNDEKHNLHFTHRETYDALLADHKRSTGAAPKEPDTAAGALKWDELTSMQLAAIAHTTPDAWAELCQQKYGRPPAPMHPSHRRGVT